METYQVRLGRILPTILEFLRFTTTALREARIADLAAIGQYLSTCIADGFCHMRIVGLGDALITLTMIIGTHIEDGMILAIVPANQLIILLDEREEVIPTLLMLLALLHLGQEP